MLSVNGPLWTGSPENVSIILLKFVQSLLLRYMNAEGKFKAALELLCIFFNNSNKHGTVFIDIQT